MRLKDGSEEEDAFAYVKAANKACRNALRALLPERVVNETIQHYLELEKTPPKLVSEAAKPPSPSKPAEGPSEEIDRSPKPMERKEVITVRFVADVPAFYDTAFGRFIGPFKAEEVATLLKPSATALIQSGKAVPIPRPPKEDSGNQTRPWTPITASNGKIYGDIVLEKPGVLHVKFDEPLPVDPNLEAGPGGWLRKQFDIIKEKDKEEGKTFEWVPEWVAEGFLGGIFIKTDMEKLNDDRLRHLKSVLGWTASRSLTK